MAEGLLGEALLRPSCRCLWKDFSCNASPRATRRAETVPEITVRTIISHIYIDKGLSIDMTSRKQNWENDFPFFT